MTVTPALPVTAESGKGIALLMLTMVIFATQDAVTKHLAQDLAIAQIVMVRFWAFAIFILLLVSRRPGGVRHATKARRPWLQILRSLILVIEIGIFAYASRGLPLADMLAIMAIFPLVVTALSVPLLGEKVGIRRWSAVLVGFAGVLIILRPGAGVFDPLSVLALISAVLYALYNVLTRMVSAQGDSSDTTVLYTAVIGAVAVTLVGPWFWVMPRPDQWMWLGVLSVTGITGHWLLIKALEAAPASVLQPFNYTLLVWATVIGYLVFDDLPDLWTVIGAAVIVASGLYTIFRERRVKQLGRV